MTADEVKRVLGLEPHPCEGGWFCRTYESAVAVPADAWAAAGLPYDAPRRVSSAIYYLLEPGTFSEMHRLGSDEVFHHYAGAGVEMLQLWPDGRAERVVLGKDLAAGQRPQTVVPRNVWQGSRMVIGAAEEWALMGCTVSPAFDYADYEAGVRAALVEGYPVAAEMILALTREQIP